MRRFASAILAAVALPLLAFAPADQVAPTHWALLIGISDYINLEDEEGGDLLAGASDARLMRDVLVMRWGVPEQNVRLLTDHDATRAGIEEAITGWLADNVRPEDLVTVYYAGHGSQMWDESGDEEDALDETIAPADVLPASTENDISDDLFGEWLDALPGEVTVFIDMCHSGTATRDVTPFSRGRQLGRDLDLIERPAAAARRAVDDAVDATGFDAGEARILELSAAQPNQIAVETFFPGTEGSEPFYGGAFTTFLVQQLWKAPADATYEQVFDATYEALKRNRFQQDPYISEDVALKDQPLFHLEGRAGATGMTFPVTRVTGSRAELGAGLALGITAGSVFETGRGARLVVQSVGQRATVTSVTSGSVDSGDQARLVEYRYPMSPLLVNVAAVDTRIVEELRNQLGGGGAVTLVEDENTYAHLLVRRGGDELRVIGTDGFARHTAIRADATGAATLADVLRKEAASKRLGDMDNPAQDFDVRLELLGGRTSFGIGEEIGFAVESERDGYLTLVDLGTDGTVAMLLPNAGEESVRVTAGRRLEYPDPDGPLEFRALEPAGGGLVRAFVTAEPLDLVIPTGQEYAYGGADFAEEVTSALMAAAGEAAGAVRLDTWGTASIVYDIHD